MLNKEAIFFSSQEFLQEIKQSTVLVGEDGDFFSLLALCIYPLLSPKKSRNELISVEEGNSSPEGAAMQLDFQ